MSISLNTDALPLTMDPHGTVRVGGTCVTLDLVVAAFRGGLSAEEIAEHYTVLDLPDVYTCLDFIWPTGKRLTATLRRGSARQVLCKRRLKHAGLLPAAVSASWPGCFQASRL